MKYAFYLVDKGHNITEWVRELYDSKPLYRATVDEASNILGYDMSEIMFSDDDRLNQTAYTQPGYVNDELGVNTVNARRRI